MFVQKFISPIFPGTFKTEKAQKRTWYFLTKLLFEGPFGSSAVPLSSFCERGGLTALTTLPPFPHTISQIYILHYIHKFSTQQCNKKSYDLELTSIYRNFVFRSSRFLSTAAAAAASHSKAAAITQYASQKMLLHPATTSSIQHPLGKKSCGTKQVAAMHYIKL